MIGLRSWHPLLFNFDRRATQMLASVWVALLRRNATAAATVDPTTIYSGIRFVCTQKFYEKFSLVEINQFLSIRAVTGRHRTLHCPTPASGTYVVRTT